MVYQMAASKSTSICDYLLSLLLHFYHMVQYMHRY